MRVPMYNVQYEDRDGEKYQYLSLDVEDRVVARKFARLCRKLYVNKPYPNGRGFYDVHNVRVIRVK